MTEPGIDWQQIFLAAATGTGGGIIGVILQSRRQAKQDERNAKQDELALEVARLSAKKDLRAIADEAMSEVVETLRTDNREIRERLSTLETKYDAVVTELAAKHEHLRIAEQALIDTERKLAAAELERDTRSQEAARYREQIVVLENTVAELRAQVEKLTAALKDCAKTGTAPDIPTTD